MKNIKFLFLIACITVIGCESRKESSINERSEKEIDYEKERAAILKVLEEESAAFWDKDFVKYSSYWVQEDYIRTMGWWEQGGVTVVKGWNERGKRTKEHMELSPEPNPTATKIKREDINLRIYDNIAWMTFDQYGEDTGDTLMDMPDLSRETRIFEKQNGEWKIAYLGWLLQGQEKENEQN